MNNSEFRALHTVENPCMNLKSALHIHGLASCDSTTWRSCSTYLVEKEKKNLWLWICVVQICVIPGAIFMVLITVAIKIKTAAFYVPGTVLMDSCACSFPPDLSCKRCREMPSSWASELLLCHVALRGEAAFKLQLCSWSLTTKSMLPLTTLLLP